MLSFTPNNACRPASVVSLSRNLTTQRVSSGVLMLFLSCLPMAQADETEIETVIVMGDRLQRNQQESVVSARIFNSEDIKNINAFTVIDLLNRTANVVADENSFTIRGIRNSGVSSNNGGSDAATVFVDGVTVTSSNVSSSTLGIWDVASVEVLRGAQSTNQGANTLAGAVIIRTQDPTFESNSRIRLRAGENGSQEAAFAVGGGLIDDVLAYRVSLQHLADDGYISNPIVGDSDYDHNKELNGRIKLLWQPTSLQDTEFLLTLARQEADTPNSYVRSLDPYDRENLDNTPYDSREDVNKQAGLEISHVINDSWSFKSVSAWSQYLNEFSADGDSVPVLDALSDFDADQKLWSQELRLNYNGDRLRAVVGLYAANTVYKTNNLRQGSVLDIDGDGPFPAVALDYVTAYDQENTNYALYFDADYDLNDWLTLNVGGRLDKTTVEYEALINALRAEDLTPLGIDTTCAFFGSSVYGVPATSCNQLVDILLSTANGEGAGDADDTAFLPKLGLTAALTDDVNLGFSVQRAFRSAGASLNVAKGEVIAFDPEFSTNYEISLRTQWLDNRLTVNANVFYVDWEDMQVVVTNPINTYDFYTANAGESVLKGAELEVSWQATDNIDAFFSLGFVDTEFKEFVSFNTDYAGNEFPNASDTTASFGINWRADSGYFASLNGRYVSDNYSQIENSSGPDSFSVFDTSFGYTADKWQVTAYVKNLFDKEYLTYDNGSFSREGFEVGVYRVGAPQQIGATVEFYL